MDAFAATLIKAGDDRKRQAEDVEPTKRQRLEMEADELIAAGMQLLGSDDISVAIPALMAVLPLTFHIPFHDVNALLNVLPPSAFNKLKAMPIYWQKRIKNEYPDYARLLSKDPTYREAVLQYSETGPLSAPDACVEYLVYQKARKRDLALLAGRFQMSTTSRKSNAMYSDFEDTDDFWPIDNATLCVSNSNMAEFVLLHTKQDFGFKDIDKALKTSVPLLGNRTIVNRYGDGILVHADTRLYCYPISLLRDKNPRFSDWLNTGVANSQGLRMIDVWNNELFSESRWYVGEPRVQIIRSPETLPIVLTAQYVVDYLYARWRNEHPVLEGIKLDFGPDVDVSQGFTLTADGIVFRVFADAKNPHFGNNKPYDRVLMFATGKRLRIPHALGARQPYRIFDIGRPHKPVVLTSTDSLSNHPRRRVFVLQSDGNSTPLGTFHSCWNNWLAYEDTAGLLHTRHLRRFAEQAPNHTLHETALFVNADTVLSYDLIGFRPEQEIMFHALHLPERLQLIKYCFNCKDLAMQACTRCDRAFCNVDCQRAHWPQQCE